MGPRDIRLRPRSLCLFDSFSTLSDSPRLSSPQRPSLRLPSSPRTKPRWQLRLASITSIRYPLSLRHPVWPLSRSRHYILLHLAGYHTARAAPPATHSKLSHFAQAPALGHLDTTFPLHRLTLPSLCSGLLSWVTAEPTGVQPTVVEPSSYYSTTPPRAHHPLLYSPPHHHPSASSFTRVIVDYSSLLVSCFIFLSK
jgi:hypothetical protein